MTMMIRILTIYVEKWFAIMVDVLSFILPWFYHCTANAKTKDQRLLIVMILKKLMMTLKRLYEYASRSPERIWCLNSVRLVFRKLTTMISMTAVVHITTTTTTTATTTLTRTTIAPNITTTITPTMTTTIATTMTTTTWRVTTIKRRQPSKRD